jgi:hypothetical protein
MPRALASRIRIASGRQVLSTIDGKLTSASMSQCDGVGREMTLVNVRFEAVSTWKWAWLYELIPTVLPKSDSAKD